MEKYRVLDISGSIGLGHVMRDVLIADEVRRGGDKVDISWIATGPAKRFLEARGERFIPEAMRYYDPNQAALAAAQGPALNLFEYGSSAGKGWLRNIELFKEILKTHSFDLVVADEAYEISYFYGRTKQAGLPPFVEIIDFVGFEPMSNRLSERFKLWIMNRVWSRSGRNTGCRYRTLFVGEREDVPEERFGLFLPRRSTYTDKKCVFIGYVLGFKPGEFEDREALRRRLGYGKKPLVVCSSGGTAVGAELLTLCGESYPLLRERLGDFEMVLVCGPAISPDDVGAPAGVKMEGFVPRLYEHLAACDIAVVQGGGSTTLELTALERPFLYFPLEGHFEQQHLITRRLKRHGAGVRMSYAAATPESLADTICEHIGTHVHYRAIPAEGARHAAENILQLLK
jgi:UDP:flavonoid glycosyltransferase YjiC (YdhE family)